MKLPQKKIRPEAGFTIVELMIATVVFSSILIVVAAGIVQFTNSYYRGVHASSTQNAARSLTDAVSQAVQFGSADVSDGLNVFCAGGQNFTISAGALYDGASNSGGARMSPQTVGCAATASNGKQFLSRNMRITTARLTGSLGGVYSFTVTVAYGENDLLCAGSCTSTPPTNAELVAAGDNISCKPGKGSQYCAVSTIRTSIKKRVN